MLQGVTLDSRLELLQELEGVLDGLGFGEVVVDECLQLSIQLADGNIEAHIVLIELRHPQIQQILAPLLLELVEYIFELDNQLIHFLQIMLTEIIELLYVGEHLNELLEPLHKHIELIEDLRLRKIESLALGHLLNLLLGDVVSLLVVAVELDAAAEDLDDLGGGAFPDVFTLGLGWDDLLFAVFYHLVGDFYEQAGHLVRGVVETGDGVDHLDCVHQGGQGVDDLLGRACVQRLNEFL